MTGSGSRNRNRPIDIDRRRKYPMKQLSHATAALFKPVSLDPNDLLYIDVTDDGKHFNIIITDKNFEGNASFVARESWINRIPEKKRLTGNSAWQIAATDYAVEIIAALWPANQITFPNKKAKLVFNYFLLTGAQQEINATAIAAFKAEGITPEQHLDMSVSLPLTKYQQVASYCCHNSDGFGLFMEQGTGKTPIVIAKICNEALNHSPDRPYRAIVVCPKNVRHNWVSEFERFGTTKGRVTIIRGNEIERITGLIEATMPANGDKYCVAVISYESMARSLDVLQGIEWDLAVLDESHYIKHCQTKRAQAAFKLRDNAKCRLVLTGTPVSNTPLDLYSQFEFMGQGWSGFSDWWAFKEFYGVYAITGDNQHKKLVDCQNLPFMKERLARCSFLVTKKEALPDLPDKVYDSYECEMGERQTEVYKAIAQDLLYECDSMINEATGGNAAIVANNVLTRLLRLAQIASGYAVYDTGETEYFPDNPKLQALREILAEKSADEKTIVWSSFVPCIKQVEEMLKAAGIGCVTFYGGTSDAARIEAERKFNYDADCKVFIGNPAAGGTGLNLLGYPPHHGELATTNANHAIYYVCDWSLVKRAQSEDRCYRMGTRQKVRITDLMVPGTVDEDIRIRVLKKKIMSLELTDVREMLNSLLHGLANIGKDY